MTAQIICPKTYQLFTAEEYEEHKKKKCFPLMLKPLDITLRTAVPVNIVAHMLERMGIPVLQASQEYPDNVYEEPYIPETPPSPPSKESFEKFRKAYLEEVSESEEEEQPEKKNKKKTHR